MSSKLKLPAIQPKFLRIAYFALVIFVLEITISHILNYIYDYFDAMLVISYVILGIGIGAYISSKIKPNGKLKPSLKTLFIICSLCTTLSLYTVIAKMIILPSTGIGNFIFSLVFFFPSIYITNIYSSSKINTAFLSDMIGCVLGVITVSVLFIFFHSETIILLILTLISAITVITAAGHKFKYKIPVIMISIIMMTANSILLYQQLAYNRFDLYNIIQCTNLDPEKTFCKYPGKLVKSYDNLVGRIDITEGDEYSYKVSYDGYSNDHINMRQFGSQDPRWPTYDIRVTYGVSESPKVLVIGSSAQGIIKPLKQITPAHNIDAIEINPAIIKIMKDDFYYESGEAYSEIETKLGNGISYIKSTPKEYDIITLINTHTYRNLFYDGPPDYLHTTESYNTYLDHLTSDGYILFEERPVSTKGKLALYRMIRTIIHTLQERGVENPMDHIIIWSWNWNEPWIDEDKYWERYYLSMIVTKNPVQQMSNAGIIEWIQMQENLPQPRIHMEFMSNYKVSPEFKEYLQMTLTNDFSKYPGFDTSIATNNRPFVSQPTQQNPKLNKIILNTTGLAIFLWILFTIPVIRKCKNIRQSLSLNFYFILIGLGFFTIETILLQVYQNIFISTSTSFVLVIGTLLLFSGIGGFYSNRISRKNVLYVLIPGGLTAILLPNYALYIGIPAMIVCSLGVFLTAVLGFLMGTFFPGGLAHVHKITGKGFLPHFIAINAIAGSLAVPLTLYSGITIGYFYTTLLGIALYVLAEKVITRIIRKTY